MKVATNMTTYLVAVMLIFLLLIPSLYGYKRIGTKPQLLAPSMSRLLSKSMGSVMLAIMVTSGNAAVASSGGGLDYANANLKEQGSCNNYKYDHIIP